MGAIKVRPALAFLLVSLFSFSTFADNIQQSVSRLYPLILKQVDFDALIEFSTAQGSNEQAEIAKRAGAAIIFSSDPQFANFGVSEGSSDFFPAFALKGKEGGARNSIRLNEDILLFGTNSNRLLQLRFFVHFLLEKRQRELANSEPRDWSDFENSFYLGHASINKISPTMEHAKTLLSQWGQLQEARLDTLFQIELTLLKLNHELQLTEDEITRTIIRLDWHMTEIMERAEADLDQLVSSIWKRNPHLDGQQLFYIANSVFRGIRTKHAYWQGVTSSLSETDPDLRRRIIQIEIQGQPSARIQAAIEAVRSTVKGMIQFSQRQIAQSCLNILQRFGKASPRIQSYKH